MKTIHKYVLDTALMQNLTCGIGVVVSLPTSAQLLAFGMQNQLPCMWAMIDKNDVGIVLRRFQMFGTGHDIPKDAIQHLHTFHLSHLGLVLHLFEMQHNG